MFIKKEVDSYYIVWLYMNNSDTIYVQCKWALDYFVANL